MTTSAVILVLLLVLCIPAFLLWSIVKLCRSQTPSIRWVAVVPTSILAFLFFQVYVAFYPREEFYQEKWKMNTGFEFPRSAVFKSKSATYPDQHGDFWAAAVIEVDSSDFEDIEGQLKANASFSVDTSSHIIGVLGDFEDLTRRIDMSGVQTVFVNDSIAWFRVALFKDRRTIIFERYSS